MLDESALRLTTQKRIKELEQEIETVRRENEEKGKDIARLEKEKEKLQRERDQLKEELEAARRAAKRQAADLFEGQTEGQAETAWPQEGSELWAQRPSWDTSEGR